MGCDIHLYVEQRQGDQWASVPLPDILVPEWIKDRPAWTGHPWRDWPDDRSYSLFSRLARVRFDGREGQVLGEPPRGLPDDLSPEVTEQSEYWGVDGHSRSWRTWPEFAQDLANEGYTPTEPSAEDRWLGMAHTYWMLERMASEAELRVVFWFDN